MATTVDEQPARPTGADGGWTWKRLLIVATIATLAGLVLLFVLAGVIPPLALFGLLMIVGVFLVRTKEKPGAIVLGVAHLAMFASSLPFTIPALSVPASAWDFGLTLYLAVLNLVALAAAIPVIRGRGDEVSGAARTIAGTALVVIVVGLAFAIYSSVSYDSDVAQEGDIRLTSEGTEFSDATLQADEGTVSLFLDNNDQTTHTFTIDELDVDLEVPGGKSARVTFEAERGEYTFYCVPHKEDMEGNLSVY